MAEYAYVGPVAHDSGNDNLPIHRIVVHCTAGADAKGARGTAKYFQEESATGSAHAITDPDELVISAYDTVVCWHAPPNLHSIGIEICCSLANDGAGHWTLDSHQKMLHRAARWVAEKCHEHGIPVRKLTDDDLRTNPNALGICGHVDVTMAFHQSTHTDPGPYFPWSQFLGYVTQEFNQIAGGGVGDVSNEEPTLSGFTAAQLSAIVYGANAQYGKDLWAAPTGTGTALIKTVTGIAKTVAILSSKLDALSAEEAKDDADLAAAKKEIEDGLAALKAAVAALQAEEVADHPKA